MSCWTRGLKFNFNEGTLYLRPSFETENWIVSNSLSRVKLSNGIKTKAYFSSTRITQRTLIFATSCMIPHKTIALTNNNSYNPYSIIIVVLVYFCLQK